jgi:serine/threonine protein kinase
MFNLFKTLPERTTDPTIIHLVSNEYFAYSLVDWIEFHDRTLTEELYVDILSCMTNILDAVRHLHEKNFTLPNSLLQCENILLKTCDGDGMMEAKLNTFEALAMHPSEKARVIAPELMKAENNKNSKAGDIFQLGIIFLQLLLRMSAKQLVESVQVTQDTKCNIIKPSIKASILENAPVARGITNLVEKMVHIKPSSRPTADAVFQKLKKLYLSESSKVKKYLKYRKRENKRMSISLNNILFANSEPTNKRASVRRSISLGSVTWNKHTSLRDFVNNDFLKKLPGKSPIKSTLSVPVDDFVRVKKSEANEEEKDLCNEKIVKAGFLYKKSQGGFSGWGWSKRYE